METNVKVLSGYAGFVSELSVTNQLYFDSGNLTELSIINRLYCDGVKMNKPEMRKAKSIRITTSGTVIKAPSRVKNGYR